MGYVSAVLLAFFIFSSMTPEQPPKKVHKKIQKITLQQVIGDEKIKEEIDNSINQIDYEYLTSFRCFFSSIYSEITDTCENQCLDCLKTTKVSKQIPKECNPPIDEFYTCMDHLHEWVETIKILTNKVGDLSCGSCAYLIENKKLESVMLTMQEQALIEKLKKELDACIPVMQGCPFYINQ